MANYDNIKDKGFNKRSTSELREISSKGGKNSGATRRRKADFRKTLNLLLTTKIDSPEWTPLLESLGLESTLEYAINLAMIKEALSGNVKAYDAIARYSGQNEKSDVDLEEQRIRTEERKVHTDIMKAKSEVHNTEEIADDGFMEALSGYAKEDWTDEEDEAVL